MAASFGGNDVGYSIAQNREKGKQNFGFCGKKIQTGKNAPPSGGTEPSKTDNN